MRQRQRVQIAVVAGAGLGPSGTVAGHGGDGEARHGLAIPGRDAARIQQRESGIARGIDAGGGLAGVLHHPDRLGHRLRALLAAWRGRWLRNSARTVAIFRRRRPAAAVPDPARVRRVMATACSTTSRMASRVQPVGGGARRAPVDHRPHRKLRALLGHVLVNGVVGEARQRLIAGCRSWPPPR